MLPSFPQFLQDNSRFNPCPDSNMLQTNQSTTLDYVNGDGDGGGSIALGVGAASLITSTNSKYPKLWRRSLYVGIFISLKKTAPSDHDPPLPLAISEAPPSRTSSDNDPPSTPAISEVPPSRTSSAKSSNHVIDIHSDNEDRSDVAEIGEGEDLNPLHNIQGFDGVTSDINHRHSESTVDDENQQVLKAPVPEASFLFFLMNNCKGNVFTIFLLLISAGLSFATEIKEEGPKYGWHDGIAIVIAMILLVAFPSVANFWRQRKKVKSLKNKNKLEVTVIRGSEEPRGIAISDLKAGDTVILKCGDEVPADGLLINGENFELDPKIDAGSKQFLFSGSKVIKGNGRMVVKSVEDKVYLSGMHSLTAHGPERKKVLETRIEKPVSYIDYLSICISVIIALVVLIRLVCKQDGDNNGLPEIKGKISVGLLLEILEKIFFRPQGKISILTSVLTVAAICVQHGMPLTITLSLKYQVDKMIPNQAADVHDLSTFGTMGMVTVLCIDTSSQLICELVEVSKVRMGEKDISTEMEIDMAIRELFQQAIGVSVLAPELSLCPMLNSLVSWAEKLEMNIVSLSQNLTIVKHRQPHSVKEGSGVLVKKAGDDEQVLHLHWSGAASTILNRCSHYFDSRGECHAMENQKTRFVQLIEDMEGSGLRPIAFAYRKTEVNELEQDGLVLLAVIGLKYTFQNETKSAMNDLKSAGIKIILVSEDDIMAVRHIACGLGISENCVVFEGEGIEALASTVRLDKVDLTTLMGSFLPEHKLLMVRCLQEKDHVVAFFGGSTTIDAAILKKADVGIVEISRSTTMARDNSGTCIKCFSALPHVVRAGRCIYQNVQKFTQLQVTTCISGSFVNLIAAMSIGESPLTAVQLIWVNVGMCFLGGHMMSMKLTSEEQLEPFDSKQSLVTEEIMRNIAVQVFYQVSVFVLLQFGGQVLHNIKEARKTMIFNTFMLCQIFNLLLVMQIWKKRALKAVLHGYTFLLALGTCLVLQFLMIHYAEGLAADGMQLNGIQWVICILFAALSWGFEFLSTYLPTLCASMSANPASGFSSRRRWFYLSYLGIPFFFVLFLPMPYYIVGMPFR